MELSTLIVLGLFLLAGHAAHAIGAQVHVPRVTLLLLLGVIVGPYVLDLVPADVAEWFPLVAQMALAMVGFLLGERFLGRDLRQSGRTVLWISLGETLVVVALVFLALLAVGAPLPLALLLAGIAPATAPAATVDVVQENHAKGPLADVLLRVVAIDDAWGVIMFSLLLVLAEGLIGEAAAGVEVLSGVWEVLGAGLLGFALGIPMAWVTGRVRAGEPTLLEASGFVFLCAGLALALELSYLVACIVLGATVANRAKHHTRPFRDIEGVSEPFLAIFFVLAGYRFELNLLTVIGVWAGVYVVARSAGKILGGRFGARLAGAPDPVRQRIGWCLLPQAGVALGLALLVIDRLPELGQAILPLVIASTVFFELIGPVVTQWHLRKAGEL